MGNGDYLEMVALQPSIGTSGLLTPATTRVCGAIFNAAAAPQTAQVAQRKILANLNLIESDCSGNCLQLRSPVQNFGSLRWGREYWGSWDGDAENKENDPAATSGAGFGYSGFWLAYWQNTC